MQGAPGVRLTVLQTSWKQGRSKRQLEEREILLSATSFPEPTVKPCKPHPGA